MTEIKPITEGSEVLRRQVVDVWIQDGKPLSIAFIPMPKDNRYLSVDRDTITPEQSFVDYTERVGRRPHSTWPIKVADVLEAHLSLPAELHEEGKLSVLADGGIDGRHASHASVVYSESYGGKGKSGIKKADERIGKKLQDEAIDSGSLFIGPEETA